MPIRPTVGTLMLGVAFVAVVLAAGRVHLSLGSLVFGILAIAWVRTVRWAEQQRADGRTVGRLRLAGEFFIELGPAAIALGIAFLPAAVAVSTLLNVGPFNRNHRSLDVPALVVVVCIGSLLGSRVLRRIKKP